MVGGLGRKGAPFGVHLVVARVDGLDRQKGAGPDMQGQRRPADAALCKRVEQGGGEVQTCGRRRHGALDAGEDRLIIGPVARVAAMPALDVGRQRHRAVAGECRAERPGLEVEAQGHVALGMLLGDIGSEIRRELEVVARPQPARAFGKAPRHAPPPRSR